MKSPVTHHYLSRFKNAKLLVAVKMSQNSLNIEPSSKLLSLCTKAPNKYPTYTPRKSSKSLSIQVYQFIIHTLPHRFIDSSRELSKSGCDTMLDFYQLEEQPKNPSFSLNLESRLDVFLSNIDIFLILLIMV
jgi:hypothetical protein